MGFGPPGGWGWVGWGLMMGKWTKHEVETAEMTLHFYRGRYYVFLVILVLTTFSNFPGMFLDLYMFRA